MSGGTERFSLGLRPSSQAFLAWMMKRRQPAALTFLTKFRRKSGESSLSMPMRHLTVTGTETASVIAFTMSATRSGRSIRAAPKPPFCTRSEGQPQLRLISS